MRGGHKEEDHSKINGRFVHRNGFILICRLWFGGCREIKSGRALTEI